MIWVPESTSRDMATYHDRSMTIGISRGLSPEQTISSILHEALEVLNHTLALELEHGTLCTIEAGLYQVLVDNNVDLSPLLERMDE
jgi:hypothetical protein